MSTPTRTRRSARLVAAGAMVTLVAILLVPGPVGAASPAEEVIFDGTQESFDRWEHAGQGRFVLQDDGSMRTEGGLGMLWYPVRDYEDMLLRFEWRDVTPEGGGNAGVFVRFPDPAASDGEPCRVGPGLALPEWVAIFCGHEIQINDHGIDPQKTGSVYNFSPNDEAAARVVPEGEWTSYEVEVRGGGDYEVVVRRDGHEIKRWRNSPGQLAARPTDPSTDMRQFPRGHIGLQNHGDGEVIEYRNVSVVDLTAADADPADGQGTLERFEQPDELGLYEYWVYTPSTIRPDVPAPLLVVIHGCNTTAEEQINANLHHAVAEREGFVVVYPDFVNEADRHVGMHPLRCWRFYDPVSHLRDGGDASAIARMTRSVMDGWNIDEERVYVVGMSSGAMMTSILGATHPDLYAAIGIVAGCGYLAITCAGNDVNHQLTDPELQARLAFASMGEHARVVPVIQMHGDLDTTVYPGEGRRAVQQWLMTANLVAGGDVTGTYPLEPAGTTPGTKPGGHTWSVDAYRDPAGCLVAEHWRIHEMGHYWPGGTDDPAWAEWTDWRGPSGAEATWAFFSRFRLSETSTPCTEAAITSAVDNVPPGSSVQPDRPRTPATGGGLALLALPLLLAATRRRDRTDP